MSLKAIGLLQTEACISEISRALRHKWVYFAVYRFRLTEREPIRCTFLLTNDVFLYIFQKIGFIREVFPLRSKDDITLVLQSCDRSVEAAIACFANGRILSFCIV